MEFHRFVLLSDSHVENDGVMGYNQEASCDFRGRHGLATFPQEAFKSNGYVGGRAYYDVRQNFGEKNPEILMTYGLAKSGPCFSDREKARAPAGCRPFFPVFSSHAKIIKMLLRL
jgi:hypothetical protein